MPPGVRRAASDDASALAALHALCFERGWPEGEFRDHIVGDLVWTDGDTRSLLVIREGGGQAEVLTLATHPGARGEGRAEALLRRALPELASPVLFLEVAEDNASAIALYRKLGFAEFGRRPRYYRRAGGRVDALLMEKRLAKSAPPRS